jgi:pyruvate-formate lyase-activating enzyme
VRPPDRVTSGQAALVRLTTRCDARCDFCSARGVLPDLFERPEDVEARLVALAAAGCRLVSFTGGEPLLLPDLIRWVARCRDLGIPAVDLQTNGLRLGAADRARALKAAGLASIFLSLHSAEAATHEALLGVRRAFPRALRALDTAVAAGLAVRVNCVVTRRNLGGLDDLVRLLAERLPPGEASLCLSFMAPQGWALEHLALMPTLGEAAPALDRALATGAALGVDVRIPGLCGVPGCVLPGHLDRFEELADPEPPPRIATRGFGPACAPSCALYPRCSGFWTVYLERHGTGELRPVTARRRGRR